MNRNLILLCVALFLWGVGETSFFPFLPIYLEQLGANPLQIGTIIGGYGFIGMLVHIPAGYFADKIGRRPVLITGWLTGLLATIFMGFANSLPLLIAGIYLYVSTMFIMAPMNSYISTARGRFSVQRALTLVSAFYNLGAFLGPLIGGAIGNIASFNKIFLFATGIFLLSNCFVFFIHSQPVEKSIIEEKSVSLFKNYRFLLFLPLLSLVIFALYLPQPLIPNYLQNVHHLNLLEIGRLYAISSIGVVIFNIFIGNLQIHTGFIFSQMMMAVMSVILWKYSGPFWFASAFFLLGSFKPTRSMASALIRTLVKSSNMGLAFGFAETVSAAATILSPIFAGYLYVINPLSIFYSSTLLITVSIIFSLAYSLIIKQPLETQSAI